MRNSIRELPCETVKPVWKTPRQIMLAEEKDTIREKQFVNSLEKTVKPVWKTPHTRSDAVTPSLSHRESQGKKKHNQKPSCKHAVATTGESSYDKGKYDSVPRERSPHPAPGPKPKSRTRGHALSTASNKMKKSWARPRATTCSHR